MKVLTEGRKKLVEDHLYIVEIKAKVVRKKLPKYIDFDFEDLIGYGYIGLVNAAIRFDEKKGYKFNTYANKKIWGAMMDGIRVMDWLPRSARDRDGDIEKPKSMAEIFGKDLEVMDGEIEIDKILLRKFLVRMLYHLEWKRFCSIVLRYFEGYKEREIAVMLGISTSRVSQLTRDAKGIMRRMLINDWKRNYISV